MIFVSAGHHMEAKGAAFKQYNEFDEVKLWQSLIVNYLGDDAMAVPPGTLKQKTTFINSWSVNSYDIAVEVHLNADPDADRPGDPVARGSETLYFPGSQRGLAVAETIQHDLSAIFPPNRGAKEGYYRMNPANGPDWFLRKTRCTAVIVEPEFIENIEQVVIPKRELACQTIATTLKILHLQSP